MLVKQTRNRRQRREEAERKEEKKEVTYPDQCVLYSPDTLIGKLFRTREEQAEALASGKWIKHPKMSLEDWLDKRIAAGEITEKHINHLEKIKLRDSNLPVYPSSKIRYVSQMNIRELINRGKELGLDFGTPETCPTKFKMRKQINEIENK
jgi:hypothetical protein